MRGRSQPLPPAWFLNTSETWENEEMLGHHELSEIVLLFCDLGSSKLLFLAGRACSSLLASVLPLARRHSEAKRSGPYYLRVGTRSVSLSLAGELVYRLARRRSRGDVVAATAARTHS